MISYINNQVGMHYSQLSTIAAPFHCYFNTKGTHRSSASTNVAVTMCFMPAITRLQFTS